MIIAASTFRIEAASYLSALLLVYSVLVLGWVVGSWVIATGKVPGWLFPILRFLESVVGPYVGLFRKVIPSIGPVDISPLVALLTLQLVGGLVVSLLRG